VLFILHSIADDDDNETCLHTVAKWHNYGVKDGGTILPPFLSSRPLFPSPTLFFPALLPFTCREAIGSLGVFRCCKLPPPAGPGGARPPNGFHYVLSSKESHSWA